MSDITFDAYLFFNGKAREAMEFYKDIFGGELSMMTYGEMPKSGSDDMAAAVSKMDKDQLMHSRLSGGLVNLMATDSPKASPEVKKIELSLSGTDEEKLREIFGRLSEGGNVKSPLKKEFWGDTYGMLSDKFGIDWVVNISAKK